MSDSPFHEGEQRVQRRLGVRDQIEPWARKVVQSFLPDEHGAFYAQQPFLVVGARDALDRPWVTLLAGEPGFAQAPNPEDLRIDALPNPGDALAAALREGADLGILGIELHTRRRNRVNGRIHDRDDAGFTLRVGQSFGNCPQHITERVFQRVPADATRAPVRNSRELGPNQRNWIERADTFFIGTGHREREDSWSSGMDASHRGGPPGFVEVADQRTLVFPDYPGNNHFNTLGNLELDPRAGITFVDFATGSLLQLSGHAVVEGTAERRIRFEIESVVEQPGALPLRWERDAARERVYRVAARRAESADVTSFELVPEDGADTPSFRAGQHLPISIETGDSREPLLRTYSLSGDPDADHLRISVKREPGGAVSRHLHDRIATGDTIRAGLPAGDFVLPDTPSEPIVLVSAGIGLTPLVAMAHSLAYHRHVPVWFVHGARDGEHHPLRSEMEALERRTPNLRSHVRYSRPRADDRPRADFDSPGRVDVALLEKLVPGLRARFYLCGPVGFLEELTSGLERAGVPAERVSFETFGPTLP